MTAPSMREPRKRFYDSLPLEGGGGAFAVSDATTEGVYPVGSPHFRAIRRLWVKIRRRDRDYLRLFQQTKRQSFFERLDGFAAVSVRSREPTAEKASLHSQTFRRLWFKPCAPKKDEVKSPRLFLAQRQGFAPLAARPGEQPTGLFSLRQADLSTGNSRANRLLPQTPPPSNPCHICVTENGADQSRLRFPWRRDRDLNPGRHHCLTRFRIVRVQPLRHLCKGGGHTDAEAVRPKCI